MNQQKNQWVLNLAKPMLAVLTSLLIGVLLILPTSTSPMEAYGALFQGAFGSVNHICNTLARSTPLLFTGLAAAFAFKSGVFNIGIEGQLYVGGLAAALTGIYLGDLPAVILIPLCFLMSGLAGMIWAFVPAVLKSKMNINIIIVCIMMNSIAQLLTEYLVTYTFRGELSFGATRKVAEHARLPRFLETSELSIGFLFAISLAVILFFLIYKTKFGYECRAFGLNSKFANYIGMNTGRSMIVILLISGFISGFAGAEQVLGVNQRFISNFSPGYGFTGISVALLARHNPLVVIIAAIFMGALSQGAIQMEIMTTVSRDLISSVQAVMIIFLAAEEFGLPLLKKMLIREGEAV